MTPRHWTYIHEVPWGDLGGGTPTLKILSVRILPLGLIYMLAIKLTVVVPILPSSGGKLIKQEGVVFLADFKQLPA